MSGRLEMISADEKLIKKNLKVMPGFCEEWYLNMSSSGRSSSTCKLYVYIVHSFLKSISSETENITANDITYKAIVSYLKDIQTKTTKSGSVKETSSSHRIRTWYALNSFFGFMSNMGYIEKNYAALLDKPKYTDLTRISSERKHLTAKDFSAILNAVKHNSYFGENKMGLELRDYAIIALFMSTGIRESALASLDINNVDIFEKKIFYVDKGNKYFEYPLSDFAYDAVLEWLSVRDYFVSEENTSRALFLSSRGTRIQKQNLISMVNKYSEDALGYKLSPHKLRAGFIMIMYDKYHDIEKVRRMVGHESISTTARYIATNGDERNEAASTIDALFGNEVTSSIEDEDFAEYDKD